MALLASGTIDILVKECDDGRRDLSLTVTVVFDSVPGIRGRMKMKLEDLQILTVGDLLQAANERPDELTTFRSVLNDFQRNLAERANHDLVRHVDQFVVRLPFNLEDIAPEDKETALPGLENL